MVQISQILIFFFGVSAFFFVSGKTSGHRVIGATLGLIGQVFWFIVTISAHQWWIVLLCCFYTFNWCRMLWNNMGDTKPKDRFRFFVSLWRLALRHIWYFKILGRRRAIRKDEDCEFYVHKDRKGRRQSYECCGDGHYECKNCIHFTPEPKEE